MAEQEQFLPLARIEAADERFLSLFSWTIERVPSKTKPISSVDLVSYKEEGDKEGLVGLTTWRSEGPYTGRQSIIFYRVLFDELSDLAGIAVMAHELAHAWLNEHVRPEESSNREKQADELATSWGFQDELAQLGREAENVGGSAY